jgi:hypothetical protein
LFRQKLLTILKRRAHPYAFLGAGLLAVMLATTLSGLWYHSWEIAHQKQFAPSAYAAKTEQNPDKVSVQSQPTGGSSSPQSFTPSVSSRGQQVQPAGSPEVAGSSTLQSPEAVAPSNIEVSLSVNGIYKGRVTLASGSNQCQVLQAAFEAGVISSLDMRYNSQYKTYAIYVIDGVGDPGAVWWIYTVNGKSPPYGCSGIKAEDGDAVSWKYIK